MNNRILCLLVTVLLGLGSHRLVAAPVLLEIPDNFTPGVSFVISVSVPAITNLGSYNIDLLIEGDVGDAGSDFYFDESATTAAAVGYVFPSQDFFFFSTNLESTLTQRLTLSDFDFVGADVVLGVNSAIAQVVVSTLPSFVGSLTFTIDSDFLILDTPDPVPTPVDEFFAIQSATAMLPATTLSAIPEPSSALFLLLIGVGACGRRRG